MLAVEYLELQPGNTGRVRAIDRDLKFHKGIPNEIMGQFLPKNRLPLAMYEISRSMLTSKRRQPVTRRAKDTPSRSSQSAQAS